MIDHFDGEHRFLSNFHPSVIRFGDGVAPTVEHAFQASKTTDPAWRARILAAETPGRAKRLGRQVPLRADWERQKIRFMHELVRRKFFQNDDLAALLLATGDQQLVEGNTWGDTFWGMCRTDRGWRGENWLGLLLMEVREEVRIVQQANHLVDH